MAKAGRWLAAEHPEITDPGQWARQTCAARVARVDRMAVGDYVQRHDHIHARAGKPISPHTKTTRMFFRDCQMEDGSRAGSIPTGRSPSPAASTP